jgi:hypothetical protein
MTTSRHMKLKLIHSRPRSQELAPPGKVVHDARGTAIWAEGVPSSLSEELTLLNESAQAEQACEQACDPYNRPAVPRPDKTPRR